MAEALRARIILSDIVKGGLTSSMGVRRVQAPPSLTHAPTLTVSCDTGLPSNEASTESYPQKHPDATADDITCPGVSSKPFEPQTETRAWDYAVWTASLRASYIIPEHCRADVIKQAFWNIHDVIAGNTRPRDALSKSVHLVTGRERGELKSGVRIVGKETERRPYSRKLGLNAYLTKPTNVLARYSLLLEAVLKQTPEESSDKQEIPKDVLLMREQGRTENGFNLLQLEQQLLFCLGEQDLELKEEGRGMMRPIVSRPLRNSSNPNGDRHAQPCSPILPAKFESNGSNAGFSITFVHLGLKFYQMTLWVATHANHRKWIENMTRQHDLMRERSQFFEVNVFSEGFFQMPRSDMWEPNREPVKVLALTDVAQVDDYGLIVVLSGITFPPVYTIKIFEPIDQNIQGRNKPTFRKLLQGGNDTLWIYKEFYIPVQPSSIHFLRTKLYVTCEQIREYRSRYVGYSGVAGS
ncbi:hypothetical protein V8E53_012391 [Lactarius tabidus]